MSDTLFGKEVSGTPLETRGAAGQIGQGIEQYFASGGSQGPMARMQNQGLMDLLGFDPGTIGFEGAARGALADPTDATRGLFRSMAPFEAEETERQTTGQVGQFGGLGGRFSRNAMDADTRLRGRLGAEFGRNREAALLQAGGQRNQALAALLQAVQGAGSVQNQRQANMMQFAQPGAPGFQEGIAGDLIGAAGTAAGMYFGGPAGAAAASSMLSGGGGGARGMEGSVGRQNMFAPVNLQPPVPDAFGAAGGFAPVNYAPMIPANSMVFKGDPRLFGVSGGIQ